MPNKLLALARKNIAANPHLQPLDVYLDDIATEAQEAIVEIKRDNHLYLQDELSDILWNYLNVLALLERDGLINSAEEVFAQGVEKYTERFPAMLEGSRTQWDEIKHHQKKALAQKHKNYYDKK